MYQEKWTGPLLRISCRIRLASGVGSGIGKRGDGRFLGSGSAEPTESRTSVGRIATPFCDAVIGYALGRHGRVTLLVTLPRDRRGVMVGARSWARSCVTGVASW